MSLHLEAKANEIAPTVLITGDPLRAEHFAKTLLNHPRCYNRIRGMLGFTGSHQGLRISIQGTGIGIPSTALYLHELIHDYGVTSVIRIGTCGALQPELNLGDVVLATEAVTDSAVLDSVVKGNPSATRPFKPLVIAAEEIAKRLHITLRKGPVFSTDLFYSEDKKRYEHPAEQGVLAVDMETSVIYAMGYQYQISSLALLTVSDNIMTGTIATAEDRETKFLKMAQLALEIAHAIPAM